VSDGTSQTPKYTKPESHGVPSEWKFVAFRYPIDRLAKMELKKFDTLDNLTKELTTMEKQGWAVAKMSSVVVADSVVYTLLLRKNAPDR
jgi:hypothetical protein